MKQANSLAYRNVAPGKVSISWTYPHSVTGNVAGAVILYTDKKNLPMDQWRKISIPDPNMVDVVLFVLFILIFQKSVVLHSLHPGTRYYVQIIPKLTNGELDFSSVEKFEIRTDSRLFF